MEKISIFGGSSEGVFGLDLGTTNSVVTVKLDNGVPLVLESKSGKTTPSCVSFVGVATILIGAEAYARRANEDTIYSFKKFMGTNRQLLVKTEHGVMMKFTPREVATIFIKKLIGEIKELNPQFKNFNEIHVSVPAYFDMNQREDTRLAIEEAGFSVVGVMDEPTSAAIVYQQIKRVTGDIIVFDLGGGTFDAVLVRNIPGIPSDTRDFYKTLDLGLPESESILEILDITGDNRLGGDDIDELAVQSYLEEHGIVANGVEREKLLMVAERVKKYGNAEMPEGQEELFTFEHIEAGTNKVLDRAIDIMDEMLNRTQTYKPHCVLCGGSTKSSIVKKRLSERFTLSTDIDPDLAVGVGNSIQNWMNNTASETAIVSRLAKGIGVLVGGRVKYLAEKGAVIPLVTKFSAQNATPYGDFVNIELYQGDRLTGEATKISTLKLENITGHNSEGYVSVIISLTITKNGAISVTVEGGKARVESVLSLTSDNTHSEVDLEVHPQAKMYHRFAKACAHYDHPQLTNLVEKYRETGERDLAKEIAKRLGELATIESQQ